MDFNQFVITTVQPDAKATMRGSQGQKPRKKKRLEQPPASGAFAQEHQVPATEDLPGHLAQAAEASPHSDEVDAWAEVQAMSADDTIDAANAPPSTGAIPSVESDESMNGSSLLDPTTASRKHMRIGGDLYEIWKPGDKDGDEFTDWYGRTPKVPVEQRWRIFQSDIGRISWRDGNVPPKFVYLDDRAAQQVLASDIPKAKICKFWQHDFGQPCNIRRHRRHIGRPAVKDEKAEGSAKYHFAQHGGKGQDVYYFSGDSEWKPVHYRIPVEVAKPPEPEVVQPKRKYDDILDAEPNRRAHGHNQYTPKDMLVKFGAPSFAKPVEKHHKLPPLPKPHQKTRGTENPIFVEKRLIGDMAQIAREAVRKDAQKALREASVEDLRAALRAREAVQGTGAGDRDDSAVARSSNSPPVKPAAAIRGASATRSSSPSVPQVEEMPIDVPRELSYIERRDLENRMTAQVVRGIQNQDDVQAMAKSLSTAKVKVGQLEKGNALLKQQLQAAEHKAGKWERIAEDKGQELADLREDQEASGQEIVELKRKNTLLELSVDRKEAELRKLLQQ
ncbi:hypothetical protein CB0940_08549 [Cercospora beticola]|uniref:Uncharacterized protein n=1 Tax=Cercospora beticola TaxID=122368 RepID=A0A2G5HR78_CERBT|nr:hypothetical protein CB0940_08549 [Cercospora beticola]PIA95039.1 hypothetical protein CB0940_08549 [Cercospora beticola]WPB05126.1 hypothetical protein RHO25_009776 [Cercospora beticola]CAK1364912.1 unnamed protein product [Cercospora beticola]